MIEICVAFSFANWDRVHGNLTLGLGVGLGQPVAIFKTVTFAVIQFFLGVGEVVLARVIFFTCFGFSIRLSVAFNHCLNFGLGKQQGEVALLGTEATFTLDGGTDSDKK